MPTVPFDSTIYRGLFHDPDIARLLSDSAEVRAMLLVEGALAKVQGELGLIPETSATFIHRAAMEVQIDPAALTAETATNAVPVPALVRAFRHALDAPEHAAWVHYGATSQDIMDTALALRLRQVLTLLEGRARRLLGSLAVLARAHAHLPMAARTWGQNATVTTFGAVVAEWGRPVLRLLEDLEKAREHALQVSLSGAAGTLSAMGDAGPEVRRRLAASLGLRDPGASWHNDRLPIAGVATWASGIAGAAGKMGEDLLLLTHSGIEEVSAGSGGASSTMPQKSNPVGPSVLVALARHAALLSGATTMARLHREQRDGAAWMTEWLSLPQILMASGQAVRLAADIAAVLEPNARAMRCGLDPDGLGLVHAERIAFALAERMPRPEAQAAVKSLAAEARTRHVPLPELLTLRFPELDIQTLTDPMSGTGQAPADALAFAAAAEKAATTADEPPA
ncbi:MAG: adenylosuccinate lyase family protein [Alphaproteobacteria bacterium]|nr:MAG: adenylosuccinate lyase family protein [Alphaproteobacteria bacterium]